MLSFLLGLKIPIAELLLIGLLAVLYWALQRSVIRNGFLAVWDEPISCWVVSRSTPRSTRFFTLITNLGRFALIRLMGLLVVIGLILIGDWRRSAMMVGLLGITIFLSRYLKMFVPRKRPDFPQNFLYNVDTTFPSGHTLLSTAFYAMLGYLTWIYGHGTWLGWIGVCLFAALVLLIGFSRIYLGFHFLTDVLGGWLIGLFFFFLVVVAGNWVLFNPIFNVSIR